ncbi:MAG: transcription elongation factor GreB [Casimicrobiaceae bacterium]|nr:transcription elongation factor GreB [Casimicrobiaceae bacterium]MCX8097783.1 transcription elongation factor GreB [Casimicrobiaceae bacterium]MDW8311874.1 transcription elongation factor GreB [Burkholderiales bacterium]
MSKAFTREEDLAAELDEEEARLPPLPSGTKNYMTPGGYARLKAELVHLTQVERPEVTRVVAWAAGNGDRSENGDYLYGKRRLREIDRRIRYLIKRLDEAEIVDPASRDTDQIFFGATVELADARGQSKTISIVGIDEVDPERGYVSWLSPIARALIKHREGDTVRVPTPSGVEEYEVLAVRYVPLATDQTPRALAALATPSEGNTRS